MDAQRTFQKEKARSSWREQGVRAAAVVAVGAIATLAPPTALADPLSTGSEEQVSGASPFGALVNCGSNPGVPEGMNFLDSEVEPWVDVNPDDPDNIVAFWQQDRWSNGGARANVAGVSFDGGTNWETVVVPGLTDCSGPAPLGTNLDFDRASDPWVSFAPNGTLHQISLVFDADPALGAFGPNGLAVSKSEDGGLSWTDPILIIEDEDPNILNDKQSLTADPTSAGFVYAVWDRLRVPRGSVVNPENVIGLGFKSPFYFARSTDGGDTWEPARKIYDPGGNNQTIGHQLLVLPNGTLVDFFDEILNFRNDDGDAQFDLNLALLRSPNKGVTWLPRGRAIRVADIQSLGVVTPDEEREIRDADILFDVAVDPVDGTLYAVWQDSRFSGFAFDEIAFMMSTDGGLTWSEPIKVNQTPENTDVPLRQQAFIPSVVVAADDGTVAVTYVAVTYYDFRNDEGTGELVDHFAVHCHPAPPLNEDCSDPASWGTGDELRLTAASFNILEAPAVGPPMERELFIGDYVGLASDGSDFLSVFAKSGDMADDPATIFFRRATTGPTM